VSCTYTHAVILLPQREERWQTNLIRLKNDSEAVSCLFFFNSESEGGKREEGRKRGRRGEEEEVRKDSAREGKETSSWRWPAACHWHCIVTGKLI